MATLRHILAYIYLHLHRKKSCPISYLQLDSNLYLQISCRTSSQFKKCVYRVYKRSRTLCTVHILLMID